MSGKTNVWARRRARRALVQAVYQWQMNQSDSRSIEAEFAGTDALKKADTDFFREVLQGVLHHSGELDEKIAPELDRSLTLFPVRGNPVPRTAGPSARRSW